MSSNAQNRQNGPLKPLDERVSLDVSNEKSSADSGILLKGPNQSRVAGTNNSPASLITVIVLAATMAAMILAAVPLRLKQVPATAGGLAHGVSHLFVKNELAPASNTALLLDNNAATCAVTRAAIEHQGYTVLVAHNKKEAFDILEHKPDNVALIVMPRRMFDRALLVSGAQVLITN